MNINIQIWFICYLRTLTNSWDDFNELVKDNSSIWQLTIDTEEWINSTCSCPYYLKNYKCKHIIGIASRTNLPGATIPVSARDVPLGQKRKRGAPKKRTRALIVD